MSHHKNFTNPSYAFAAIFTCWCSVGMKDPLKGNQQLDCFFGGSSFHFSFPAYRTDRKFTGVDFSAPRKIGTFGWNGPMAGTLTPEAAAEAGAELTASDIATWPGFNGVQNVAPNRNDSCFYFWAGGGGGGEIIINQYRV